MVTFFLFFFLNKHKQESVPRRELNFHAATETARADFHFIEAIRTNDNYITRLVTRRSPSPNLLQYSLLGNSCCILQICNSLMWNPNCFFSFFFSLLYNRLNRSVDEYFIIKRNTHASRQYEMLFELLNDSRNCNRQYLFFFWLKLKKQFV